MCHFVPEQVTPYLSRLFDYLGSLHLQHRGLQQKLWQNLPETLCPTIVSNHSLGKKYEKQEEINFRSKSTRLRTTYFTYLQAYKRQKPHEKYREVYRFIFVKNGGPDGTRTRDLRRDRPAF